MQRGQLVMSASRALTTAEIWYAQIEKELLAILFACTKFDLYIYGRSRVLVETDHKTLEAIFRKRLCDTPTRLQRMLLVLQKYDLCVVYKKGTAMYLADMLSRVHLNATYQGPLVSTLEAIEHRDGPAVSTSKWKEIDDYSACDPVIQKLRQTIHYGWPNTRSEVDPCPAAFLNTEMCFPLRATWYSEISKCLFHRHWDVRYWKWLIQPIIIIIK